MLFNTFVSIQESIKIVTTPSMKTKLEEGVGLVIPKVVAVFIN